MFADLLLSRSGMSFKLPDVASTCCRGWHFLRGKKKKLTIAKWFFCFNIYLGLVLPQPCDWNDVNITLFRCCLPFLCVWQIHRYCCLELSTTFLTALFPTWRYSHLWLCRSALHIMANGNLFGWLLGKQKSSNLTTRDWKFSCHSSFFQHGFLPLLLEFEHAEQHMGGGAGPGCVRGGIPCTPSQTVPTLQHLEREKCCGCADTDFPCQSQD